jgi:hypothetical protein
MYDVNISYVDINPQAHNAEGGYETVEGTGVDRERVWNDDRAAAKFPVIVRS